MRIATAALPLVASLAMACGGSSGPSGPPSIDIVTGTYSLVSFNGERLPATLNQTNGVTASIMAGTLVVTDSTYAITFCVSAPNIGWCAQSEFQSLWSGTVGGVYAVGSTDVANASPALCFTQEFFAPIYPVYSSGRLSFTLRGGDFALDPLVFQKK